MRKFLPLIIIGAVVLIGYFYFKGINNTAVTLNQNIEEAWGNVETTYQRRNDLIVNLVKTVQGAAEYEKGTLEAVIQARANATKTVVDHTNITPEQLEILKIDPEARADLFGQHALVHNINPDTNIMATDLNTFGLDMDSVAIALQAQYGELAGAAASGVSKAYGGEPELHAPRTGLGGAIMTDLYFRRQALTNERVAEAINGGRPLRAITQGLGKAGSHYLRTLPYYIQPVGAMERNGAIIADDSEYLDRDTILALARDTGLDQESVSRIPRTLWLPPATPENSDSLREFWAAGRADVLIPAFDRGQFTSEDAQRFDGSLVVGMANEATDEATQAILAEKEVDEIPDAAANIGGTLSSRRIGQKFRDKSWTQQTYETNWQQDISNVGEALYEGRDQLRQERSGEFVPLREIVARIAVQRAMDRAYLS